MIWDQGSRPADAPLGTSRRGPALGYLICAVVGALLLLVGYELSRLRSFSATVNCQSNLLEAGRAARLYASDFGDRLPQAGTWCDVLEPYHNNSLPVICPAAPGLRCGYDVNAGLSGGKLQGIPTPQDTVMFFDGRGGWNATGGREGAVARHRWHVELCYADGRIGEAKLGRLGPPTVWNPPRSLVTDRSQSP